eukprot:COSAG06_NODE_3775_length_4919_cov_1.883817_1_plen_299_part_00
MDVDAADDPGVELIATESARQELQRWKLKALKARAKEVGVTAEELESIDDADDPKAAAIDMILLVQGAWKSRLRAELRGCTLKQLKARATEAGVGADEIDAIDDADEPKAAAVQVILAWAKCQPGAGATTIPEGVPSPSPSAAGMLLGRRATVFSPNRVWRPCIVVSERASPAAVCVHYEGFRSQFDEWLPTDSAWLRQICLSCVAWEDTNHLPHGSPPFSGQRHVRYVIQVRSLGPGGETYELSTLGVLSCHVMSCQSWRGTNDTPRYVNAKRLSGAFFYVNGREPLSLITLEVPFF